jgi:hypothetical protein
LTWIEAVKDNANASNGVFPLFLLLSSHHHANNNNDIK